MRPRILNPLARSVALSLTLLGSTQLVFAQSAPKDKAPKAPAAPDESTTPDATPDTTPDTTPDATPDATPPVPGEEATTATTRLLVVPIAGRSKAMRKAAKQVTIALASAAVETGAKVETSAATRAQITDLSDCRKEAPECMQSMLDAVGADLIVLGSMVATEGGWILTIKQVTRGEADKIETHILKSKDPEALEAQIQEVSVKTFAEPEETPDPIVNPDPFVEKEPHTPLAPQESSFSLRRVSTPAWAVTGAGAAVAVAGTVMLYLAASKQDAVDTLPDTTLDEINKLQKLEDKAERYEVLGNSFLIAGAITTAAGATWAIIQAKRGAPTESPAMTLTPSPTQGGAMVTFTLFQ